MARNTYDIDEEIVSQFDLEQFKRLARYAKPYKKLLFGILIVVIFSSLAGLATPLLMKYAIDDYIPNHNVKMLVVVSSIFFVLVILGAICMKYRIRYMSHIGNEIIADIRTDLFEHIGTLSLNYFDSRPHGKILVRVVNYVNSLSDLLSNGFINLVTDLFGFFVALGIMYALNWKLSLVVTFFVPISIFAIFSLKNRQRKALQEMSSKQSNMNAYIHESISGMKVTQSFTREEVNYSIFNNLMDQYTASWMKSRKIIGLVWPIVKNISVLSQSVMLLVALTFFRNEVTAGDVVAFLGYTGSFWMPLLNISDFYNQLVAASAYLELIFETMDIEPDVKDVEGAYPIPEITGAIEFDEVTFGYEMDQIILEKISFTVKPGETIALVGPTGAGKTTVVNLISRFYNVNSGCIRIDGHDISKVTLQSLRSQMGIMMQDTFIFSGTIMENIRYSKVDATDDEVIAASMAVRAHNFIIDMEMGYQTEVNERGTRLSTGQRQLLSFARALLADPKILILDEATSSIDTQTEKLIQEGLEVLLKGRTSFVIAHRLSTIKNASRILVINQSGIEEAGTHDELIQSEGHYYKLFQAQMKFLSEVG